MKPQHLQYLLLVAGLLQGGIGEDGLSFVDSATKNGAGVRAARDHNDWRSTTWPEANQYRVNSSPRYCNKCRKKIQDRLDAFQPDGNEGTVTVESGQGEGGSGGASADGEELELKNLCEDVVFSQLLKRVASLRWSLAVVKKKTAR
jgi:hypothetical protein